MSLDMNSIIVIIGAVLGLSAFILALLSNEEPILTWIRRWKWIFVGIVGAACFVMALVLIVGRVFFHVSLAQLTQIVIVTAVIFALVFLVVLLVAILAIIFRILYELLGYVVGSIACIGLLFGVGYLLSLILSEPALDLHPILSPILDPFFEFFGR